MFGGVTGESVEVMLGMETGYGSSGIFEANEIGTNLCFSSSYYNSQTEHLFVAMPGSWGPGTTKNPSHSSDHAEGYRPRHHVMRERRMQLQPRLFREFDQQCSVNRHLLANNSTPLPRAC